jgi:hypothetical protein
MGPFQWASIGLMLIVSTISLLAASRKTRSVGLAWWMFSFALAAVVSIQLLKHVQTHFEERPGALRPITEGSAVQLCRGGSDLLLLTVVASAIAIHRKASPRVPAQIGSLAAVTLLTINAVLLIGSLLQFTSGHSTLSEALLKFSLPNSWGQNLPWFLVDSLSFCALLSSGICLIRYAPPSPSGALPKLSMILGLSSIALPFFYSIVSFPIAFITQAPLPAAEKAPWPFHADLSMQLFDMTRSYAPQLVLILAMAQLLQREGSPESASPTL